MTLYLFFRILRVITVQTSLAYNMLVRKMRTKYNQKTLSHLNLVSGYNKKIAFLEPNRITEAP